MTVTASTLNQLCTFRLGPLYLGINVIEVREVLHKAEITAVPHAHPVVEGLINLRGQIATCVDLRRRLGLPPRESDADPIHVVTLSVDGEPISLLVDAVGDVVDVDPETYERPPATMHPDTRDLILGTYKLDTELLLVLDLEQVNALHTEDDNEGEGS
jgi:purine-binding chemotaxis protein CheW